ncbi:perlucin-like protein isoform X2 [Saccostrea cucullata]|uniref:perlucin-like protein isoform X2 n=1 Tax=Saccostrea cuccullata TaxID=36930 RepID=UPI002ED3EAE0
MGCFQELRRGESYKLNTNLCVSVSILGFFLTLGIGIFISSVAYLHTFDRVCVCSSQEIFKQSVSGDCTSQTSPVVASTSKPTGDQGFPWKVFGKSQYLHVKKQIRWLDAQIECLELGAKLAEIETLEENIFLKNMARKNSYGNTFIGGTDAYSQHRWRWSTTFKAVTYTDWGVGKPDLSGGDECMGLSIHFDMSWDDMYCDQYQPSFMCERLIA